MILTVVVVISCAKEKDKKQASPSTPTTVLQEEKEDVLIKELEKFDENYSEVLNSFYNSLNRVNSFVKNPDKNNKESILKELTSSAKRKKIKLSAHSTYKTSIDSLENIYNGFISLNEDLKNYLESEVWKENANRSEIYQIGEKAEKLSRQYEHTFNNLMKELD